MSGLGDSAVGLTPLGIGAADEAAPPPALAPQTARYMDPATRDYALASDGSYQRMPELRQRVLLAITESKGSSTVRPDSGVEVPSLIDASFERRVKSSVSAALAFLVIERALRIDSITIDYPHTGRTDITVSYTDLQTGARDTATA